MAVLLSAANLIVPRSGRPSNVNRSAGSNAQSILAVAVAPPLLSAGFHPEADAESGHLDIINQVREGPAQGKFHDPRVVQQIIRRAATPSEALRLLEATLGWRTTYGNLRRFLNTHDLAHSWEYHPKGRPDPARVQELIRCATSMRDAVNRLWREMGWDTSAANLSVYMGRHGIRAPWRHPTPQQVQALVRDAWSAERALGILREKLNWAMTAKELYKYMAGRGLKAFWLLSDVNPEPEAHSAEDDREIHGKASILLEQLRRTPLVRFRHEELRTAQPLVNKIVDGIRAGGVPRTLAIKIARQLILKLPVAAQHVSEPTLKDLGAILRREGRSMGSVLSLSRKCVLNLLPKLSADQAKKLYQDLERVDPNIARTVASAAFRALVPAQAARRYMKQYHDVVEALDSQGRRGAHSIALATFTMTNPLKIAEEYEFVQGRVRKRAMREAV